MVRRVCGKIRAGVRHRRRHLRQPGGCPAGRKYHECDIDTIGENSRGAKRLVYSDDGRIYYTEDHYETFTLLYGEE